MCVCLCAYACVVCDCACVGPLMRMLFTRRYSLIFVYDVYVCLCSCSACFCLYWPFDADEVYVL